jgi:hypothetical protein
MVVLVVRSKFGTGLAEQFLNLLDSKRITEEPDSES